MTPEDESYLKVLSIFYYIFGGLSLAGGLCGALVYGVMGAGVMAGAGAQNGQPGEEFVPVVFVLMSVCILLMTVPFAILDFYAAGGLRTRRRRVVIYVAAAFSCLSVPLGTILGIFTFIVMARPSVSAAFDRGGAVISQSTG